MNPAQVLKHPVFTLVSLLLMICTSFSIENLSADEGPCGILENYDGVVRILDSSRKKLIRSSKNGAIACGNWVSVEEGWAQLKHHGGSEIHLGSHTFVEFLRRQGSTKDDLTLFKGQIYVQVDEGQSEFSAITETGRAKIKQGKVILGSNTVDEQTQLVVLENTATLENRLEASRKITVREGESSILNLKLLRVVPQTPQAISVASLKPTLFDLKVSEKIQTVAIRTVMERSGRNFAAAPKESRSRKMNRGIASVPSSGTYLNEPEPEGSPLREHLFEKMVGGSDVTHDILHPDAFYGKSQSLKIQVEDPASKSVPGHPEALSREEVAEKKRLIEELSKIKVE